MLHVDHIGADLFAVKGEDRLAVSVKSRRFDPKETRGFTIETAHINKLTDAAEMFGLSTLFAFVASVKEHEAIHLFMIRCKDFGQLPSCEGGHRMRVSTKEIDKLINLPCVDYTRFSEQIASELTC